MGGGGGGGGGGGPEDGVGGAFARVGAIETVFGKTGGGCGTKGGVGQGGEGACCSTGDGEYTALRLCPVSDDTVRFLNGSARKKTKTM